jgi:hypothetical protein
MSRKSICRTGGVRVREKNAATATADFPAGVTEINSRIAAQTEAGKVFHLHGHLPGFQHEEQDVRSFRMFTSQTIEGGTVKPKEIVKTFGVPMITVKRYVKLYREHGSKGFYEAEPRHSSASVLAPVPESSGQAF